MMISSQVLKDILVSNESFILESTGPNVSRENAVFPTELKKTYILYGVRRSGKSYILYDLFKKWHEHAFYLDFEDERLVDFKASDFEKLRETLYELKPDLIKSKEIVLLLDEIQNVAGWEKFTRRITERGNIRVIVTGSSSKIMPREIHTALRGRSWSMEILPFSFREFLKAKGIDWEKTEYRHGIKKALIKNQFMEYLKWGGFPESTLLKEEYNKIKLLREYLDAMFFKDLVERFEIKNMHLLDAMWDGLFSSFSTKYSLNAFCKQYKDKFAFSKDSVFAYHKYFLENMLVFEVKKLSASSYARLRNPAKVYLVDTGLARKVTHDDTGRLFENAVYLELRRRDCEIFYGEDKRECDFVVRQNQKWFAYQVTWLLQKENTEREIQGLVEACRTVGLKEGWILTHDEEGDENHQGIRIKIKPAWKWMIESKKMDASIQLPI